MKLISRKTLTVIVALMLVMTFVIAPSDTYAASKTVKSTTFNNTLKSGSTVYCTDSNKLYAVDLRTGAVRTLYTGKYGYVTNMKKKGNYLYFNEMSQGVEGGRLNRINLKTAKKQVLAKNNVYPQYAIRGSKIYYVYSKVSNNGNSVKQYKKVMNLNGKKKKSTKTKIKMTSKLTNANGYFVNSDFDYNSYDWSNPAPVHYYLITPTGNYLLATYEGPIA